MKAMETRWPDPGRPERRNHRRRLTTWAALVILAKVAAIAALAGWFLAWLLAFVVLVAMPILL